MKAMNQSFQNNSFHITRRSFLTKCTVAAAATGLPLWAIQHDAALGAEAATNAPSLPSPNARPGIALIGCGGQGGSDAGNASGYGDILAVCDVNQDHLDGAARRSSSALSPDSATI